MATSVQFRPQNSNLGMVMRQVDEDLAIFLRMRNAKNERNDHPALGESEEFGESRGDDPKSDGLLPLNASQEEIIPIAAGDKFLNLEIERSDYNWLVNQPDSSLFPMVEVNVQDYAASRAKISNDEAIYVKSEPENTHEESTSLSDGPLHQDSSSASTDSSTMDIKRPSSSGPRKPTPRAATPTARSTFQWKSKPSRASTPTSRSTLPSLSKPQSRSSTPTGVITSRSSTPSRPSRPIVSKPALRSATPTRKTGPAIISISSKLTDTRNKRPESASRGRLNRLDTFHEKPIIRQQNSCSPPKVRAPNSSGCHKTGSKMMSLRSRGCINEGEDVSPVLMGAKMVDRVVNMRKLAPPKQDEYVSQDNLRKSSHENPGFGRSLSKKSLDMAIRHMDIRRSISNKLRPE